MTLPIALDTPPMEAETAASLPVGTDWQFEPKWDGFRCLAFRDGESVELRSKSGQPLGRYFPDLVAALAAVGPERFVLDGEIVIPIGEATSFEELQLRLHPAASRVRTLAAAHPARLMVFDLLVDSEGQDWSARPLVQRRPALEAFVAGLGHPAIHLSPCTQDAAVAHAWLDDLPPGQDGVMCKRLEAPYRAGVRDAMVKLKRIRSADCVVGGFRYLQKAPLVGSLLLGLYDAEGRLDHVGFTSTIARDAREALTAQLRPLEQPPGFTGRAPGGPSRWSNGRSTDWHPLRPDLVVEVQYDQVSADRFRHGTTLLRFRPDKAPAQCLLTQIARRAGVSG